MKKYIALVITLGSLIFCLFHIDYNFNQTSYWEWISLGLFILLVVIVFIIFNDYKTKRIKKLEEKLEIWNSLSYNVKRAGDAAFNELPIGIILYDNEFEIKWSNRYANSIFKRKLAEQKLNDVDSNLFKLIESNEENLNYYYNDRYFDIVSKKEYNLLYFFDSTSKVKLQERYNNRVLSVIFISFDYYEESLNELELSEMANIRGQYLAVVSDYAEKYNGFLSVNNDISLIVTTKENLNKIVEDKFDILDKIKEVSKNANLRITASIGAASYDVSFEEVGTYAKNALDLAEKRGGDQAVVNIEGEKIKYFGGKTNALEKTTKIEARLKASVLKELIEKSSNVLIMGHTNLDADSFASCIAILKMAQSSNILSRIVINEEKIDNTSKKILQEVRNVSNIYNNVKTESECLNIINDDTLLIIVDCQSPKMVLSKDIINKSKNVAIIDHHRSDDEGYKDNVVYSYIEPYASSTIELVIEMMNFYIPNLKLSELEATIMLMAIIVDTNDFTFRTGIRTFEVAGLLKQFNANTLKTKELLREDLNVQKIIYKLLNNVEIILNKFAIVRANENEIYDRVLLAKVSNELLNIDNIQASFTIGKISENTVGISARSLERINVQLIMEELGGGGHLNNAACQIKDKSINEIYDSLKKILIRDNTEGEDNMKVILLEDLKGKGKKEDIIEVALGYGNFLISSKKALLATPENIKDLEDKRKALEKAIEEKKEMMNKVKNELNNKQINIGIKVGHDGKLFGSITTKMVADELENQLGIIIDKRKIHLDDINSLGIYEAKVDLFEDIQAVFYVNVVSK